MVELAMYSGRLGNCMFMYAFASIIAEELKMQKKLPKGVDTRQFPLIGEKGKFLEKHTDKYTDNLGWIANPMTINGENDNVEWLTEKGFLGKPFDSYDDFLTINKILKIPNIESKYLMLLGNFEVGENYLPYRNMIKKWFTFPEIDFSKIEFFKLHSDLGKSNYFTSYNFDGVHPDDLVISLRLEDYTSTQNLDRLLLYDYFKIILEKVNFRKLYIITNPGSIGHGNEYKYLAEFYEYDPIFVRIYNEYAMSIAFGAKFNNIAISQSTFSWWVAFLSEADNIYYPIPIRGPFSLTDKRYFGYDLRVASPEYKYVDYGRRTILPNDSYTRINYKTSTWD